MLNSGLEATSSSSAASGGRVPADNNYVFGEQAGFIYTSPNVVRGVTVRHTAALLMSADYASFEVTPRGGAPVRSNCIVVAPLFARSLSAQNVPLVSVNICPLHTSFGAFRALRHRGLMPLDRHAFNGFDAELTALYEGRVGYGPALDVFDRIVAHTALQLPPAPARDPRADEMTRIADENPDVSIEELARRFGQSPARMARLFASVVGMSLRDYRDWTRWRVLHQNLYSERSLTDLAFEAGFADSPQLSRTVQRWFGHSPSDARDPAMIRTVTESARSDRVS